MGREFLDTSQRLLIFFAFAWASSCFAADDIPFGHLRHASLHLDCAFCHGAAKTGTTAGMPAAATCQACHPKDEKLAGLSKTEPVEPARSVYQLAEFAIFSHARHRSAKIVCQTCHGNVWEMEEVRQVLPMTMKACVECHRASHATTACRKCHPFGS